MKDEDIPKMVAEALGWELRDYTDPIKYSDHKWWFDINNNLMVNEPRWQPHENLSQIVRWGVPWLANQGHYRLYPDWDLSNVDVIIGCLALGDGKKKKPFAGQGTHPDEKMADALCKVILKVAEGEK